MFLRNVNIFSVEDGDGMLSQEVVIFGVED
jgi:hypothetical protein